MHDYPSAQLIVYYLTAIGGVMILCSVCIWFGYWVGWRAGHEDGVREALYEDRLDTRQGF